jgi:hypothetical protein
MGPLTRVHAWIGVDSLLTEESHSRLPFVGWLPLNCQRRNWKRAPVSPEHVFYPAAMKDLKRTAERAGFEVGACPEVQLSTGSYPT